MALLESGDVVSRYTIVEKLATGGMAEVYLANQEGPSGYSKTIVLKVILPHLAQDQRFLKMFQNEARIAALINHPHVVQIFDYGRDSRRKIHFIAMEHIEGASLLRLDEALRRSGRRLPLPLVLRIGSDACRGLHFAHTLTSEEGAPLGIIHRDIALDNILVSNEGQVKLVDFGVAKMRSAAEPSRAGMLEGKYEYLAPEVIRGEAIDPRVDLYAMGVVLYRLLLGRAPFTGTNELELLDRIVSQPPPAPRAIDATLPEELERLLLKALHQDPRQRYPSAERLGGDLDVLLRRGGQGATRRQLAQLLAEVLPQTTQRSAPAAVPATVDPKDLPTVLDLTPPRKQGTTERPSGGIQRWVSPVDWLDSRIAERTTEEEEVPSSGPVVCSLTPSDLPTTPLPDRPQAPSGLKMAQARAGDQSQVVVEVVSAVAPLVVSPSQLPTQPLVEGPTNKVPPRRQELVAAPAQLESVAALAQEARPPRPRPRRFWSRLARVLAIAGTLLVLAGLTWRFALRAPKSGRAQVVAPREAGPASGGRAP